MREQIRNTVTMSHNRSFRCLFWLGCSVGLFVGCAEPSSEKQVAEQQAPETNAAAPDHQRAPGHTSEHPDSEQAKHTDRSEGEQVSVVLMVPEQPVQPGMQFPLTVKFKIAPLWEIRTIDAQPEKLATQLELKLPDGFQAQGDWQVPPTGRSMSFDSHPVYSGEAVFQRTIEVGKEVPAGPRSVTCQIHYQACDEQRCLSPVQKDLKVTVQVKPAQSAGN
ncbi:MAG: hypothetical protein CME32_10080 [Gimesia sp.]|nr:hypothetical protein [Gimesia sp.]